MKKKLIALFAVLTALFAFGACGMTNTDDSSSTPPASQSSDTDESNDLSTDTDGSNQDTDTDMTTDTNEDTDTDTGSDDEKEYLYQAFTPAERNLFIETFGFVIPFAPNDVYYVEEYSEYYEDYDITEQGVNFYTYGNTQAEFEEYLSWFTAADGYVADGTDVDSYGDTWYYFVYGDYYVDICYWETDSMEYTIDVYVYGYLEGDLSGSGDTSTDDSSNGGNQGDDFTASEKALFEDYFGFVIPFIESEEYYVEEYSYYYEDTDETEIGVNFYAYDLTQTEFNGYKALFSTANGYTSDGTDVDDYGDTWYYFSKNDHYIDLSYYVTDDGSYVLDVYVYDLYEGDLSDDGSSGGGNSSSDSGDQGGGNQGGEDVDLITNDGKGLPAGENGVYDVNFNEATYVKNVTEQGYYLDGCPTTGQPQVLVVPVEFSDVTAASKGYTIDKIKAAFFKGGATDYFSVYDYYYQASYGQLDVQFTVLENWFRPSKTSTDYKTQKIDYFGSQVEAGDQMVMDELLAYLDGQGWDLSQFDSDNNGVIDAIVFVTTLKINSEITYYWAYRYWNLYTDDNGNYFEYDGVSANDYLWAPYQFLYETYDEEGDAIYDENVMNTYTFIHEFGHVLGADDYYDYSGKSEPMAGCDVMDGMLGDHNAFTKFNYGWLTTSRLVVAENSVTLTLEDFSKNGDTIIIANNWDAELGAYQEYYVLVYLKNTGLNDADKGAGYFARDGVVVYHVNASLYVETEGGETYYDIYNNNNDVSYEDGGTVNNLIEYVKSAGDTFTYIEGDTMPTVKTDGGETLAYNFVVDSITEDAATITFTKNQ
jgi:M6 family metalloprotease-like protein